MKNHVVVGVKVNKKNLNFVKFLFPKIKLTLLLFIQVSIFLILSTTITSIFVSKVQANASERAQHYLNQIIHNKDDNGIDIDN